MKILKNSLISVHRSGRFLVLAFQKAHQVLSTCRINGGLRSDLSFVVNHQSCEGKAHDSRFVRIMSQTQAEQHAETCAGAGTESPRTAVLGTAANMQQIAVVTESFGGQEVTCLVSAGVSSNATCAGDPAAWVEQGGAYQAVGTATVGSGMGTSVGAATETPLPEKGTINIILAFNVPLSPGALVRAAATLTEAKSAALHELGIASKQSWEIATGTGTDQFALCAPLVGEPGTSPVEWPASHTKMGELIGLAVRKACRQALLWQNGLEPSLGRSTFHALGRFGLDREGFKKRLDALEEEAMGAEARGLLLNNFDALAYDPASSSVAWAMAAIEERRRYGVIPELAAREALLVQAQAMARGLAAGAEPEAVLSGIDLQEGAPELADLAFRALIHGWNAKWK